MPMLVISLPAVPDVTNADWAEYVVDAVRGWAGGYDPADPLFQAAAKGSLEHVTTFDYPVVPTGSGQVRR